MRALLLATIVAATGCSATTPHQESASNSASVPSTDNQLAQATPTEAKTSTNSEGPLKKAANVAGSIVLLPVAVVLTPVMYLFTMTSAATM